jgi:dTDP-4-amino-4,6-dideoxygalactose transaminase
MIKYPLFKPYISPTSILPAIRRALSRSYLAGIDSKLYSSFDYKMKKNNLTNHRKSIPCSNGTAALFILFRLLGVKKVISQSYTYKAVSNAAKNHGCEVVYLKSRGGGEDFFLPSSEELSKLKKYNSPDYCLVLAPMHGIDITQRYLDQIRTIAPKLIIILDKAQNTSQLDFQADFSTYSFIQNKEITCGEGGAISFSGDYDKKITDIINQEGDWGFNFRMSNINIEIIVKELDKFWKYYSARKRLVSEFNKQLNIDEIHKGYRTMYFLDVPSNFESVEKKLMEKGIPVRVYPDLLTNEKTKYFIPFYLGMKISDIGYITSAVKEATK